MKTILCCFLLLSVFPILLPARETPRKPGSIYIRLDAAKYGNLPFQESFVIMDKFDGTCAGMVLQKFPVHHNEILLTNIPRGKYYMDVFTLGKYRGHFRAIVYSGRKIRRYTLKLSELRLGRPGSTQPDLTADTDFRW